MYPSSSPTQAMNEEFRQTLQPNSGRQGGLLEGEDEDEADDDGEDDGGDDDDGDEEGEEEGDDDDGGAEDDEMAASEDAEGEGAASSQADGEDEVGFGRGWERYDAVWEFFFSFRVTHCLSCPAAGVSRRRWRRLL